VGFQVSVSGAECHCCVCRYDAVEGVGGEWLGVTEAGGSASVVEAGDVYGSPVGSGDEETQGVPAAYVGFGCPLDRG